jgi:predicted permease
MTGAPAWRRYLTFWRTPIAQDVHDELRFHTVMRVQEYIARGMSEDEARRAVAERLGDMTAAQSECVELSEARERHRRNAAFFDVLRADLRYAIRGIRARPGFATAIIVTLGLGIGANAAVFSVVDRLLFRAAPMLRDIDRTHRVYLSYPNPNLEGNFIQDEIAFVRIAELSKANRSFVRTAAFSSDRFTIGEPDEGCDRQIAGVTASFFSFFDAPPALGRYFDSREDAPPNGAPVVVLSYGLWQTEYGGRVDALGAKLRIGQNVYTVIGVAPRWFAGMTPDRPPAAFIPFSSYAASFTYPDREGLRWWTSYDAGAYAKMLVTRKPGVSIAQASSELTRLTRLQWGDGIAQGPPDLQPTAVVASTLAERGPEQTSAAKVAGLVGAMALVVLLIAGANVANLFLARALRRRREVAVRLALGISRRRLVSQLLTETLLLAGLGGLAGLAAARWGGPALRAAFLTASPDDAVVSDVRTLMFVGVSVVVAGVLTGIAPAWQAGRLDVTRFLRIGVREGTLQRSRARAALLVLQGALSVLLLVAAGLFVRSLSNVRGLRLGYDVNPLLVVDLNMRGIRLDSARAADLWTRLAATARRVPGVERAALAQAMPFRCCGPVGQVVRPPDMDSVRFFKLPDITSNAVAPEYFAAMGTRILRGRAIDSRDVLGGPRVAVVSSRLAGTLWPGRDAIGQCLMLRVQVRAVRAPGEKGPKWLARDSCASVVGVAENVKNVSLADDPSLTFYLPYSQETGRNRQLAIRTNGDAAHYAAAVRTALQREMPGASYVSVTPYEDVIGQEMRSWQLGATMFAAFGVLAMALAAGGLYSIISYNVAQRTHEMGVRRALGAQASDVVRLVVKQGLLLGGVGVLLGGAIALIMANRVQPLLFQVSPRDPVVYGSVIVTMLGVALAASFIPARRAAAVDPNIALRAE